MSSLKRVSFATDLHSTKANSMQKLFDFKLWQQKQQEDLLNIQKQQQESIQEKQNVVLLSKSNALNDDLIKFDDDESDFHQLLNHVNGEEYDFSRCQTDYNENSVESIESDRVCDEDELRIDSTPDWERSDFSISSGCFSENSPVVPGVDGRNVKTFEDLINQRLGKQQTNDNNNYFQPKSEPKPKQPFLKKGSGLLRFQSNPSVPAHKKSCSLLSDRQTVNSLPAVKQTSARQSNSIKDSKKTPTPVAKSRSNSKLTEEKMQKKFIPDKVSSKSNENESSKVKFNKKVMIMSTKQAPKKSNANIIITRNDPVVCNKKEHFLNSISDDESLLFDYLEDLTGSSRTKTVPIVKRHSPNEAKNECEVRELEGLLKKVELKKRNIQKQLDDEWVDVSDKEQSDSTKESKNPFLKSKKVKKKVRWNQNHRLMNKTNNQLSFTDETPLNLSKPQSSCYTEAMRQQMLSLEMKLSELKKQCENKQQAFDRMYTNEPPASIESNDIKKLCEQVEKLNKRLINIETRQFDLSCTQNTGNKQNKKSSSSTKYIVERNKAKYIASSPDPNGISSVTQLENESDTNFPNGDQMKILPDNTILYTYANGVTQTTFPNGMNLINFPNGQVEKIYNTGVKHITYPNGCQRIINPDGSEELFLRDGTLLRILQDGTETLDFPNGDREIRTNTFKRREYSNGTTKTLYSDGTQETRYANGRLRIKDNSGKLVVDSRMKHLNEML